MISEARAANTFGSVKQVRHSRVYLWYWIVLRRGHIFDSR